MITIAPVRIVWPKVLAAALVGPAQAREDRHERGGQARRDQHVERDLRDPERGVVGVELGAGADRCSRRRDCG